MRALPTQAAIASILVLLWFSPELGAQNQTRAEDILIRNVTLIDPAGQAGERVGRLQQVVVFGLGVAPVG